MDRDFIIAKNLALRLLNRYDKTQKEMREYLIDKSVSKDTANKVVDYLVEYNFLNDKRYAKNYINKKISRYGEKKIFFDLILKGLDEEFLKSEFQKISDDQKIDIGVKICQRKYDSIKGRFEDFKIKHKLICHMVGKGYDYNLVAKIIEKVMKDNN